MLPVLGSGGVAVAGMKGIPVMNDTSASNQATAQNWATWDKVVQELDSDGPLSPGVLHRLRAEITEWDCEEWPPEVGHALLNRLIRLDIKER
jgi:hypothetical protein